MTEKICLIDCDAGPDDAWALFMAIAAHREPSIPFRIVGITCTQGNTSVDNVAVNVTRTLQAVNESSIPVYSGADTSVVVKYNLGDDPWAGQDGFGDAGFPPIDPVVAPEHAVDAIIALAEEHQGNLTLIALGPLTNIALAVRRQPKIKTMVKELYILGGNVNATGNDTLLAEFNFSVDPEAAFIVLEAFAEACPMFVIPWETALAAAPTLDFRLNTLGSLQTPQVTLLNQAEAKILENAKDIWTTSDSIVVAMVISPGLIVQSQDYYCSVELSGKYARGLMVVDKNTESNNIKNCTIVKEVNRSQLELMYLWAAGGGPFPGRGSSQQRKRRQVDGSVSDKSVRGFRSK